MSRAFKPITVGEWARGTERRLEAGDIEQGTLLQMNSRIDGTLDYEAAIFPAVFVDKIHYMGAYYAFIGHFLHHEGIEQSSISGDITHSPEDPLAHNYLFPNNFRSAGGILSSRLNKHVGKIGQSYFTQPEQSTADLMESPEDVLVEQRTPDPRPSLLRLPDSLIVIK